MAYNNAIPQGSDKLSVSQGDLLNNFAAISTMLQVNHVNFNGANQGKHKLVTFTDQTSSLPVTVGSDIDMYLADDPAYPTLGAQMWFRNGSGGKIPWTAARTNASGYSYLPSGIIMAWTQLTWVAAGANTADLDSSSFGATFPGFQTAVYNVQLTSATANNAINVTSIGAFPTFTLTYNVTATTGAAYLYVVGI